MTSIAEGRKALAQLAKRNPRDAKLYETVAAALESIGDRLKVVENKLRKKDGPTSAHHRTAKRLQRWAGIQSDED